MAAESEIPGSAKPGVSSEGATPDVAKPECSTFKIIQVPKTGTLQEYYGDWEGFCRIARKSIGRDLGSGFLRFALASSFPTAERLSALLEGAPYFIGGDEHRIVRAPENGQDRVYKFTHSDSFGCRGEFPSVGPRTWRAGTSSRASIGIHRFTWNDGFFSIRSPLSRPDSKVFSRPRASAKCRVSA